MTPRDHPVVQTRTGQVRGISRVGYDAWLGIPYAAPPTGQLRWRPPRPAEPWSGVRDATRFGARSAQEPSWDPGYEHEIRTEDCLTLNVYAPHDHAGDCPVLVWIHGGGWTAGAASDVDPRRFVQRTRTVVVTVNYRVGVLGFLNLPQFRDESAEGPGAYGLLDQQEALRWVQANISRFGGDPDRVTIAGQSAGGTSVYAHLVSPAAAGLFARAVIMSASCRLESRADAERASEAFATAAGCDVAARLRDMPTADLLAAQRTAGRVRASYGSDAFPTEPLRAIRSGALNQVPVLIGQTVDERSFATFRGYDHVGAPMTARQYEALARSTFPNDADKILAEYPVRDFGTPGQAWTQVFGDYEACLRRSVYSELSGHVPTYVYEFAEGRTQNTALYRLQQTSEVARAYPFGATHVDELGHLWDHLGQTLPYSSDELELGDQMTSYWSRFAADGDPNGAFTPHWPAYDRATNEQLRLVAARSSRDEPPASRSAIFADFDAAHRVTFWRGLTNAPG